MIINMYMLSFIKKMLDYMKKYNCENKNYIINIISNYYGFNIYEIGSFYNNIKLYSDKDTNNLWKNIWFREINQEKYKNMVKLYNEYTLKKELSEQEKYKYKCLKTNMDEYNKYDEYEKKIIKIEKYDNYNDNDDYNNDINTMNDLEKMEE